MADIPTLTSRARLEMGDLGSTLNTQFQGDGVTTLLTLPQKPIQASSLIVTVGTVNLTQDIDYTVDERQGLVTLNDPAAVGVTVTVTGTAYRYFTDSEWATFIASALDQHLYHAQDEFGALDMTRLPPVEEYPVALYAIVQALYALVNDASFDVDIHTPEGVTIPKGQRVEQLWQMLSGRMKQYQDICAQMNVGLWKTEQFDLRRVSYQTGKLVPIYQPQEFQDTRFPEQVFVPINTLGGDPIAAVTNTIVNLSGFSNETFSYTYTIGQDVTNKFVKASVRRYPQSLTPMVYVTVTVLDAPTGKVQLTIDGRMMYYIGVRKFWDLQLVDKTTGDVETVVQGTFDSVRQGTYG